jgi:prophage antirepressor-like protein
MIMSKSTQLTAPRIFDFKGMDVRTFGRAGDPWFLLADVCKGLHIANSRDAASRLDDDEKEKVDLGTVINADGANIKALGAGNGNNDAWIISESGLYSLIMISRKPEAKAFQKVDCIGGNAIDP